EHRKELANIKGFAKACVVLLVPVALIALSNFSSALLVGLMGAAILFVASPRVWYFGAAIAAAVPLCGIAVLLPQFRYRLTRITTWLDPWSDPTGAGFQTIQSLYAVASGGLFGLGLGQSRQKTFIPEAYNDIIFAIICEELGLVGAALVIMLFAVLIWKGIKIAMNAKDQFGMLVATGITSVIAFQSIINIGVVTNTIPNTGQPLPFVSYGGTSLLFLMGMVGILLNISRYPKEK
ncbi:MAG: FtsW/RodA/SpoVE family cell cycle protein, partial [Anaerotignum sp.]|nr:FtsW/RodA/SpoVE family cell cycle protein [Anaerotignum sp.]